MASTRGKRKTATKSASPKGETSLAKRVAALEDRVGSLDKQTGEPVDRSKEG